MLLKDKILTILQETTEPMTCWELYEIIKDHTIGAIRKNVTFLYDDGLIRKTATKGKQQSRAYEFCLTQKGIDTLNQTYHRPISILQLPTPEQIEQRNQA
jgi:Fe2+ or Zn2+ uptake regulation protein